MVRRVAVLAAGLAMTAGVGLAGVGAASAAATPKLHLTATPWTFKVDHSTFCEVLNFNLQNLMFSSPNGDHGNWAGGGSTLALAWTGGPDSGLLFSGSFVSSSMSYKGSLNDLSQSDKAKVVQGSVGGC